MQKSPSPSNAILWSSCLYHVVFGNQCKERGVEKCCFMFMLFLMSTCAVLCENVIIPNRRRGQQLFRRAFPSHHAPPSSNSLVSLFPSGSGGKKRLSGLIPNAKSGSSSSGKRTWWQKFFLDDAWDWFGLKEDDMLEEPQVSTPTGQAAAEGERQLSEEESFEAWKRRAEAISELREAQEDARNMESREWEDWLMEGTPGAAAADDSSRGQDWEEATGLGDRAGDIPMGPGEIMPGRGMAGAMRDLVFRNDEDELLYEDRVFRFASINSVSISGALLPNANTLSMKYLGPIICYSSLACCPF